MSTFLCIEGLKVTQLKEINDNRGSVLHMLRKDSEDFQGFGECYFSEVLPDTIKAWKCNTRLTQLIAVPRGKIKLVVFDDRSTSQSKGELQIIELGRPNSYMLVKIPPNLWYGFKCISQEPALIANCTDEVHSPKNHLSKDINDATIPYSW